jgi:DivIVA domain-containing protein
MEKASPAPSGTPRAITPLDIQQKEFRARRFGGYDMRDVDEFLDELTESVSALVSENERLRRQSGGAPVVGAPDLDDVGRQADEIIQRARDEAARIVAEAKERAATMAGVSAVGAAAIASDDERAAVNAFLAQEREFLQSLASLVQGHAESVKGMARRARSIPRAEDAASAPAAEDATGGGAEDEEPPAEPTAAADPEATQAMQAAEPIRVDEPQPAAAKSSDEADPSLRELFWGDEN